MVARCWKFLLACAVWSVVASCAARPETGQELFDRLDERSGPVRRVEGRLTGLSYKPYGALAVGESPSLSADARMLLLQIERRLAHSRSSEHLRIAANAHLIAGNEQTAIALLTEGVGRDPGAAAVWNDLAVAHLASARRSLSSVEVLAMAIDAIAQALRLNPRSPESLFNLALIADRLHLEITARDAWSRFLTVEPASIWRTAMRPFGQARDGAWERTRGVLIDVARPLPSVEFAALVATHAQQTKDLLVDSVFTDWARATLAGDGAFATAFATRALDLARALQGIDGDALLTGCAQALVAADGPPADRRRADGSRVNGPTKAIRLAEAHLAYAEGRRLYELNRREDAGAQFAQAERGFVLARSPCLAWARLQRGLILYQARDMADATRLMNEARDTGSSHGYHALAARAQWLLGLVHLQRQDVEGTLRAYEAALAGYERAREAEHVLVLAGSAADALRVIGEHVRGWRYLGRAFERFELVSSLRRRYLLLLNASLYASDSNLPRAAILFQNESLAAARARGVPNTIVEGLVRRARLLLRQGDTAAAIRDLDEAEPYVSRIATRVSAEYEKAWLDRIRAQAVARTDPGRALAMLDASLPRFARDEPAELPAIHLERGRTALHANEIDKASRFLAEGIASFEARWQRLDGPHGVSYMDDAWALFDEQIRLEVVARRDSRAAFAVAESTRGRSLFSPGGRIAPLSLDRIARRLPGHVRLLYYASLDDRLCIWSLSKNAQTFHVVDVGGEELRHLVTAYRQLIEGGRSRDELIGPGRHLFDLVVRPALPDGSVETEWLIVPDGPLFALPFAALVDTRTSRFVVQDRGIALLPAARLLEPRTADDESAGARAPHTRELKALLVGTAKAVDPALPVLPAVGVEIDEIARTYREASTLVDAAATPESFRQAADRYDVIHFAGHARANPALPWLSHLLLSPDSRHPTGELSVRELRGLRLPRTRLVVLAACETASGSVFRGEGVVSLAQPFLAAGASSVVATLWDVDDAQTRTLVRAFHRAFAHERNEVLALRAAQRALIESGRPDAALARGWGAFVAIKGQVAFQETK